MYACLLVITDNVIYMFVESVCLFVITDMLTMYAFLVIHVSRLLIHIERVYASLFVATEIKSSVCFFVSNN